MAGHYEVPPSWTEDRSLSEAERIQRLLVELGELGWTVVAREVSGHHPHGARPRIDVVLEVPNPEEWHPGSRLFGLEAKPRLAQDANEHAALVVQAFDYRYTEWDGFGFLPIIIWPEPFAGFYREELLAAPRAILSKVNLLPLRWVRTHGWWLGKNVTRLWSAKRGATNHARRWDLSPSWGRQ